MVPEEEAVSRKKGKRDLSEERDPVGGMSWSAPSRSCWGRRPAGGALRPSSSTSSPPPARPTPPASCIMLPLKVLLGLWLGGLALSEATSTNKEKKTEKTEGLKTKRGYELGTDNGLDVELFQAGLTLADHVPYGLEGSSRSLHPQSAEAQLLIRNSPDFFLYTPGYTNKLHQELQDVPTSPPGNPKKPVYHYTPLPRGTFPDPKGRDAHDERISDKKPAPETFENLPSSYLFGYRVNDAASLVEMGRQEYLEGDLLRGAYHVLLPDHRMQIVRYWSDLTGFHPTITYA